MYGRDLLRGSIRNEKRQKVVFLVIPRYSSLLRMFIEASRGRVPSSRRFTRPENKKNT